MARRSPAVALLGDARGRVTAASARGGRRTRLALALAGALGAALLGAFLFGSWHVLFGGLVKGNWRAGGFGVALAGGTAVAMVLEVAIVRHWLASADPPKSP
jgi:membrane protease YdiL (CAAX protease family)